jgi:hypothetical protein
MLIKIEVGYLQVSHAQSGDPVTLIISMLILILILTLMLIDQGHDQGRRLSLHRPSQQPHLLR